MKVKYKCATVIAFIAVMYVENSLDFSLGAIFHIIRLMSKMPVIIFLSELQEIDLSSCV